MKQQALHILVVEDNVGDVRLLREMLGSETAGDFELTHLRSLNEAEVLLAKGGVDIVLLDMGLPDSHGLDTVRLTHAAAPDVPIIVLTGLDDEELFDRAMKVGAQDYLVKGQIETRALPRALRHAVERHRMQAETDLMRMQQLQLKDEFISHVSHELRSPLAAIDSFTEIIADGLAGETTPQQNEYLEIILRNTGQLRAMIEDLLEVGKAETGKLGIALQRVSVSEAITYAADTFQGAAAAKSIRLSFGASASLPLVHSDPTRLRQILNILLDNATKFTPRNGAVDIEAEVVEHDPAFLLVKVSDTGCGIVPEMADRIFERLYQVPNFMAGRQGLGLGLHIARELVTRMGGRMWVVSEPQKGSRFSFTLPVFSPGNVAGPAPIPEEWPGEAIAAPAF